eukprot:s565_g11.t1
MDSQAQATIMMTAGPPCPDYSRITEGLGREGIEGIKLEIYAKWQKEASSRLRPRCVAKLTENVIPHRRGDIQYFEEKLDCGAVIFDAAEFKRVSRPRAWSYTILPEKSRRRALPNSWHVGAASLHVAPAALDRSSHRRGGPAHQLSLADHGELVESSATLGPDKEELPTHRLEKITDNSKLAKTSPTFDCGLVMKFDSMVMSFQDATDDRFRHLRPHIKDLYGTS